jgi:simple sugar transport system substrate-binding protein
MLQDKMAEKVTLEYLNDKIIWGNADMVGMEDGFIEFVQDDSRYIKNVPADIRAKMADLVEDIKQKKIEIK